MKSTYLPSLICIAFCSFHSLFAQQLIHIPYANPPVIDGSFSPGEWQDADSVMISIKGGSAEVKVFYLHDSLNFYAAYANNLESANVRFPELFFDINNDKSATWMSDDWWFHASASDCEYNGMHSNYDSCEIVRPNWKAERNFTMTPPMTDTVEIMIPFSTIGIDINTVDTIGIAFEVTNTFSVWEYWPQSADIDDPSTWANAVFGDEQASGIASTKQASQFHLYPNPNDGKFSIQFSSLENAVLNIVDMLGNTVYNTSIPRNSTGTTRQFNTDLKRGIYFAQLITNGEKSIQKIIIK